jgi:hypothetical protein
MGHDADVADSVQWNGSGHVLDSLLPVDLPDTRFRAVHPAFAGLSFRLQNHPYGAWLKVLVLSLLGRFSSAKGDYE